MKFKCFFINFSLLICYIYCKENDCSKCNFTDHSLSETDVNRLKPFCGKRFVFHDNHRHESEMYTYHVGICINYNGAYDAALQITDSEKPTTRVIGRLNETDFTITDKVLLLEYHYGDRYGSHCNQENRNTMIIFYCDPNEEEGKFTFVDENNAMISNCHYVFTYAHKDVCLAETNSNGLGFSAIILLVVFPVIFSYLFIGILFKKCFRNAQGWQMLPHVNFWKEFGNLQADGCNYICRSSDSYNDERLLS